MNKRIKNSQKQFEQDLTVITDYLLENEEKHWEENDRPENHIYSYALRVRQALDKPNMIAIKD